MPEFIRVTDEVKPKREYSIVESAFIEGVHTKLDKPGANLDGTAIEPKYTPQSLSSKKADADSASAPSGQQAKPEKE